MGCEVTGTRITKYLIESSSSDEDFDGSFETEVYYDNGNAIWQVSDTTGDGILDTVYEYNSIEDIAKKSIFSTP
jgi:hypothetical protein